MTGLLFVNDGFRRFGAGLPKNDMKPIKFLFSLLAPLLAMQSPVMGQAPSPGVMPTNRLSFTTKGFLAMSQGAEIPAYDAASKRVFVSSNAGIQVVDLTNPAAPVELPIITPTAHGLPSNDVSSVTVKNGVLAACMISVPKTVPGHVAFFTASTGAFLGSVVVGANPDHLTFTPDGTKVLVCNEGKSMELLRLSRQIPLSARWALSMFRAALRHRP